MSSTTTGAALAECTALLNEEGRRAVRRYWDQVVREEWVAPSRGVPRLVLIESGRERREARRAMARVAAAGRLAAVVPLPTPLPMAGSGVAA